VGHTGGTQVGHMWGTRGAQVGHMWGFNLASFQAFYTLIAYSMQKQSKMKQKEFCIQ